MNKIASECCGSCEHWDMPKRKCGVDPEIVFVDYDDYSCNREDYSPRNPIPIIDIPGVKELVEKAYRDGFEEGQEYENTSEYSFDKVFEDNSTYEYMKALEDRDDSS